MVKPKRAARSSDKKPVQGLPGIAELHAFLAQSHGRMTIHDIGRAFSVTAEQRPALRRLLKSLSGSHPGSEAKTNIAQSLPERCLVEITGTDRDGDPLARPVGWDRDKPMPIIFMRPERRGQPALAPGSRVIAKLRRISSDRYEGSTVKRMDLRPISIIGVFHTTAHGGRIEPVDRKVRAEWVVAADATAGAQNGEIVRAYPLPASGYGPKPARIVERLGTMSDASSISLIAIASLGIPHNFPSDVLDEAAQAKAIRLGTRVDLRTIPLVTIDGADARDFDDAVFAEPDGQGYRIIVAIADVAYYVKSGSALDHEARNRGNSVYFPDRVVPMLPEALSNGWCSLRPGEDRGCLFVDIRIGADGRPIGHYFGRGLMRSAARLTYEQAQSAHQRQDSLDLPVHALDHLFAAYQLLAKARVERGTLDLDLPERQIMLDSNGKVSSVAPRPRLDSHRLIEEFMILANVAAAEELERLKLACMYRVHAPPSPEKLDALRNLLLTFEINLKSGDQLHPRDLDQVLKHVAGTAAAPLVNEAILRSQSQAQYAPESIGHFGLGLRSYAHFTSPIRRYADLLVHRALITGLNLGRDGLSPDAAGSFTELAEHITVTERRAADAERQSTDRYLAAYLEDQIGTEFTGRISGVTRFGLFVTLTNIGASGFVPFAQLPDDFWHHDERSGTLSGKRTRLVYRLADPIIVRLIEATPATGGLIFTAVPSAEMVPDAHKRPNHPAVRKSRKRGRHGRGR